MVLLLCLVLGLQCPRRRPLRTMPPLVSRHLRISIIAMHTRFRIDKLVPSLAAFVVDIQPSDAILPPGFTCSESTFEILAAHLGFFSSAVFTCLTPQSAPNHIQRLCFLVTSYPCWCHAYVLFTMPCTAMPLGLTRHPLLDSWLLALGLATACSLFPHHVAQLACMRFMYCTDMHVATYTIDFSSSTHFLMAESYCFRHV